MTTRAPKPTRATEKQGRQTPLQLLEDDVNKIKAAISANHVQELASVKTLIQQSQHIISESLVSLAELSNDPQLEFTSLTSVDRYVSKMRHTGCSLSHPNVQHMIGHLYRKYSDDMSIPILRCLSLRKGMADQVGEMLAHHEKVIVLCCQAHQFDLLQMRCVRYLSKLEYDVALDASGELVTDESNEPVTSYATLYIYLVDNYN